jgi:hypothetical protein
MGTRREAGHGVAAHIIGRRQTMHDFKGVDWNLRTRHGKVDPAFVKEFLEGIMASDWFACEIRDASGRVIAGFDGEHLWTEQLAQEDAA